MKRILHCYCDVILLFIMQGTAAVPLHLLGVNCSFWCCNFHCNYTRDFMCYVTESDVCMERGNCADMCCKIIQHYLFITATVFLYCLISTVNVTVLNFIYSNTKCVMVLSICYSSHNNPTSPLSVPLSVNYNSRYLKPNLNTVSIYHTSMNINFTYVSTAIILEI